MRALLEIRDLVVRYSANRWRVTAVDGVSMALAPGESVGLVGESGSGKSSIARAIVGLAPVSAGTLEWNPPLHDAAERPRRRQMIFQDPYQSLNPRQSIGGAIGEAMRVHRLAAPASIPARVAEILERVGLSPELAARSPHELSGGQRQRVGIARAFALEPALIVADEPVSALDVSVQAQILNLLRDLQRARGLSLLLIAHDLAAVRYVCDRILVMHRGRIVEHGPSADVLDRPRHAYTRSLLAAVPQV